ncbi:MAG: response regulator [Acidimicrobiales bacterium]
MSGPAIRVVVVDDHPVVREGLRSFLSSRDGIEVVGEADDASSAVVVAAAHRPDVVVLDLVMPGGGGLAALPGLLAIDPAPRVLVLTSVGGDDQALAAVRGGASGWLGKDVAPAELESAIRTVHRGGSVLDPSVAGRVLAEVANPSVGDPRLEELTTREREVLALLGEGMSNRELAAALYVAEKTVKTHVSSILAKLHLTDRTQAALFAVHHGLKPEPGSRGGA